MSNKNSYCNVADQIEKNNEEIFKAYYDEIFQEINRSENNLFNTKNESTFLSNENESQMLRASISTNGSFSAEQVDDFEKLLDNLISQYEEETESPNKYRETLNFISKYETTKQK